MKWLDNEVKWLVDNYRSLGGVACGKHLGKTPSAITKKARKLKLEKGKKRYLPTVYDEPAIIAAYRETGFAGRAAKQFGIGTTTVVRILRKHGIAIQLPSRFRDHQESIIADYQRGDMPTQDIAAKYGLSDDRIREGLTKLGLFDTTRYGRFANRKPYYQCWVERYGKEEADKRLATYNAGQKARAPKGEKNPMFSKPPHAGAGNGWKGWYRENYFRSLREVMFMIRAEATGVTWKTAETKEYTIRYEFMGQLRTYRPDFIVGNELWEMKPIRLHASPHVTAKRIAAEAFCRERGLVYRLEDIEIDKNLIHEGLKDGRIRFDRDYEKRFMEWIKVPAHQSAGSTGLPARGQES